MDQMNKWLLVDDEIYFKIGDTREITEEAQRQRERSSCSSDNVDSNNNSQICSNQTGSGKEMWLQVDEEVSLRYDTLRESPFKPKLITQKTQDENNTECETITDTGGSEGQHLSAYPVRDETYSLYKQKVEDITEGLRSQIKTEGKGDFVTSSNDTERSMLANSDEYQTWKETRGVGLQIFTDGDDRLISDCTENNSDSPNNSEMYTGSLQDRSQCRSRAEEYVFVYSENENESKNYSDKDTAEDSTELCDDFRGSKLPVNKVKNKLSTELLSSFCPNDTGGNEISLDKDQCTESVHFVSSVDGGEEHQIASVTSMLTRSQTKAVTHESVPTERVIENRISENQNISPTIESSICMNQELDTFSKSCLDYPEILCEASDEIKLEQEIYFSRGTQDFPSPSTVPETPLTPSVVDSIVIKSEVISPDQLQTGCIDSPWFNNSFGTTSKHSQKRIKMEPVSPDTEQPACSEYCMPAVTRSADFYVSSSLSEITSIKVEPVNPIREESSNECSEEYFSGDQEIGREAQGMMNGYSDEKEKLKGENSSSFTIALQAVRSETECYALGCQNINSKKELAKSYKLETGNKCGLGLKGNNTVLLADLTRKTENKEGEPGTKSNLSKSNSSQSQGETLKIAYTSTDLNTKVASSVQTQKMPRKHQSQQGRGAGQTAEGARGQGHGQRGQHQGRGQGREQQQQQQKKKIFEPYWSLEAVSEGIKKGHLIVGQIRINPKNYEDAYVPLPDGKADLFIGGMIDRNRALNSDEVVVLPYPREKWRVFVEDFEDYERSVSSNNLAGLNEPDALETADDVDSDDSGPDVIFVDSDDDDSPRKVDDGGGGVQQSGTSADSTSNLNVAMESVKLTSDDPKTPVKNADIKSVGSDKNLLKVDQPMHKASKSPARLNTNTKSPATPMKKFALVSDMIKSGSPIAQDLFGAGSPGKKGVGDVSMGKFLQQTGRVIYIQDKKHSRAASGRLKLMTDKNKNLALFAPSDSRVPRIVIPMSDCPKEFYERPGDFANTLFIARIQQWDEYSRMPKGSLARSLGEAGQIEPETEAMLIEMDVDDSPFSDDVLRCLPQNLPWSIPESEFAYRKDLRRSCIFTIDPATARDLDDAVSIEELGNGKYEVGVHIADVSFFVKESTELDTVASKRATSVYLVQKVVPMLPRLLCEELCSLNPDQDRLTFSVIWTINENGEIFDEWYGRSVIRSCVKLSYDHAQGFIESPEKEWTQEELPPITNSFGVKDVMKRVLLLNKIAIKLREQRFENGALRLDQVNLQYRLNDDTGLPNGYFVYQQKDSNRLIEEFMLLANMAVAHKIKSSFPDKAILRRHPPPQVKPLEAVEELCDSLGLKINAASAGALQNSLRKYYGEDEQTQARLSVLVILVSKPMQNAKYFCSGSLADETLYHHYALNVPFYTHFTSPIRRYPDIMVHRLLAASLGYCDPPQAVTQLLQRQAEVCNDKKMNAKMASDRSSDMYFSIFVKEAGPLEEAGMVMAVLDKSFDVLILKLGVVKRVYLERLPLKSFKFRKNMKSPELTIEWMADETCNHKTKHLITLFTPVDCYVFADKEPLRWSCVIRRPKDEIKSVRRDDDDDDVL